ncbi:Dipeptide/oligopeptide ABC transporter, dipeptide/oligopeptide binding protein [Acidilobus saccharovorans 345-15]|uniref:Dipeptide/oligopeptide ABC transporter, dipeptide/oligopeptide binding protein n=1 Tax=Acidilobus saccharovorans (strain DSM 16705 / JCM 18335 / VKM B-2471 / 345-15) TaxID=666510 RepID=D9PZI2_ACIS3|nr:ABC transporter substrate-binding protein [Acidilobus saccharovorans]ADL18470.1 Dipeptide/oligopeptide ABC transporter, dipeptide/oligopeptide binding protein [Acidilobus saccharovorans 345-15]
MKLVLVASLFVVFSLVLLNPLAFTARAQTSGQPASTIILKSYSGSDTAGVGDFDHGYIAFYDYAIPPYKMGTLPSGAVAYEMPSTYYDVLLNPVEYIQNPSGQEVLNPFYYQSVRFAINYIVDRSYFVNDVLYGYGIPSLTLYGGEYEMLTTSNVTAKFSNITYNPSYANETIYKTLTAHGYKYINGQWYYPNGQPVVIYVFVRSDTTVRYIYASFLIDQLKSLGFEVQPIYGNLQKEITDIYSMVPNETTWNVLIEAWGGTYGFYDWSLPASLYGAAFGNLPASDAYGTAWGLGVNTTNIQEPELTQELNIIDNLSLRLALSEFTSEQQYYEWLNTINYYGIVSAIRIGLGMSLIPIFVNSNMVTGLVPNYIEGLVTPFSFLNARTPTGTLTIGVRHLAMGSMNPVAGFTDSYSVATASSVFLPIIYYIPGNGFPVPAGFTYKLVALSPVANITVPTSALMYNATSMKVQHVPPNTTAKVAVIVNFAPLLQNDRFVDGQPITLADLIEQYLIAANVSLSSNSPIYDSTAAAVYGPSLQQIVGFEILNSTSLEIWSTAWWFNPEYAALSTVGDFIILGYAEPGGGMMPWPLYAAMAYVVAHGEAAWSTGAATSEHVDWLSLVNPTDVGNVLKAMQLYNSTGYIPEGLLEVQSLSGVQLVNETFAHEAYTDAINYINTYGNAVIGEGPYMLVAYQPGQYAKLVRNPYFNVPVPSILTSTPVLYSVHVALPPLGMVPAGGSISATVYGTPDGTNVTTTQSGVFVIAQFVTPEGAVVAQENLTSGADGSVSIPVPASLSPGSYYLVLWAYTPANILLDPVKVPITVTPMVTTTTTTTTTTSTTTTTTTTTTPVATTSTTTTTTTTTTSTTPVTTTTPKPVTISTTLIVGIVVVVIVIIAAVALLARRK